MSYREAWAIGQFADCGIFYECPAALAGNKISFCPILYTRPFRKRECSANFPVIVVREITMSHNNLQMTGDTVATANTIGQAETLAQPTYEITEACDSGGDVGNAEGADEGLTVLLVEAFPKPNQGKYVQIFDELTRQWAARRNFATQQIVKRNFKVIG